MIFLPNKPLRDNALVAW